MKYYLHNPGYIPGFPGVFPGNSIVEIDDSTNALLRISPMFPGIAPDAIVQPQEVSDLPPSSSASAASVASTEADAAVLAQSSSPDVSVASASQPAPQIIIDLPINGG